MKRYLLFVGNEYEPSGGWDDFVSDHDSIDEARDKARTYTTIEWYQIVDTTTLEEVICGTNVNPHKEWTERK